MLLPHSGSSNTIWVLHRPFWARNNFHGYQASLLKGRSNVTKVLVKQVPKWCKDLLCGFHPLQHRSFFQLRLFVIVCEKGEKKIWEKKRMHHILSSICEVRITTSWEMLALCGSKKELQKYCFWGISFFCYHLYQKCLQGFIIPFTKMWAFLCTAGRSVQTADPLVEAVCLSRLLKLSKLKLLPSHLRRIKCTFLRVLNGHLKLSLAILLLLPLSCFSLLCKQSSALSASNAFASWLLWVLMQCLLTPGSSNMLGQEVSSYHLLASPERLLSSPGTASHLKDKGVTAIEQNSGPGSGLFQLGPCGWFSSWENSSGPTSHQSNNSAIQCRSAHKFSHRAGAAWSRLSLKIRVV